MFKFHGSAFEWLTSQIKGTFISSESGKKPAWRNTVSHNSKPGRRYTALRDGFLLSIKYTLSHITYNIRKHSTQKSYLGSKMEYTEQVWCQLHRSH